MFSTTGRLAIRTWISGRISSYSAETARQTSQSFACQANRPCQRRSEIELCLATRGSGAYEDNVPAQRPSRQRQKSAGALLDNRRDRERQTSGLDKDADNYDKVFGETGGAAPASAPEWRGVRKGEG